MSSPWCRLSTIRIIRRPWSKMPRAVVSRIWRTRRAGIFLYVNASEQASVVTKELLAIMRQQYFLAIESSAAPGWYALEVKTKRQGLTVRARRGYFAGGPAAEH